MISHRHRCIFVKVPKCASTSVRDWFIAHAAGRHSFRPFWYPGTLAERMQSLADALRMYPHYLAFAFVRNPYRRFLSTYRHANRVAANRAARIPGHPDRLGTPEQYARLVAELLHDSAALWGAPATAWFRDNARRRYGPLGIPLYALGFTFTHARRQVDFLPDRNPERLFGVQRTHPAPVDFIGAVETIDADFARLRERIGLPAVPLLHRNATADAQAPAVRCDPATRRLVEQLYAADLAFTGCTSEDALPEPSARDMGTAQHPPSGRAVRPRPPPAAPAGPGTWFSRARYDLGTLQIALEDRLFRIDPLRTALRPLARRVRGIK